MDDEPQELGGSDELDDLFSGLGDFLAGEEQLIASLGTALDELAASTTANRLDRNDRAALWRRIEARVERVR